MIVNNNKSTALVTGATGFIGRHLVTALLERSVQVQALVRLNSRIPASWKDTVKVYQGDLENPESLSAACQKVDTVFHAAGFAHAWAESSAEDRHWRVNALGTRHLVQAAAQAGVERFVFLSSVKAMGEGGRQCIDEDWPLPPQTPYGKAKRAAEQWVLEAGQRHAMQVVNLRLAMVYGPGSSGNLQRLIAAIRKGWFPPLPEIGNQRSMVHVSDVVQATLIAAANPIANQQTYIVTDGQVYSTRRIYDLICQAAGIKVRRWALPFGLLRAAARLGDAEGWLLGKRIGFDSETLDKLLGWACYRSDKIQRELGFRPSRTLADSLPEMLQDRLN